MLMMLISFPCSPKGLSADVLVVFLFLFHEAFIKIYTLACESFKTPRYNRTCCSTERCGRCGCGRGCVLCAQLVWHSFFYYFSF